MLTLLQEAKVALKLEKYRLLIYSINYLGRVTRSKRLEIASHTTDAIKLLKELHR